MEFVVPLIIVAVIVIAVALAVRLLGRRGRAGAGPATPRASAGRLRGPEITREMAQEASARLTPEAHRRIYSMIAQHQVLNAVKEYRKATSSSLGESAAAVAALGQFPQPSPEPVPEPAPQPDPGPVPVELAETATLSQAPLTVADIINAAPATPAAPASYRYRAIVSRGDEVREVVSTRLNAEIYGRIRGLALSGDLDGAASLLRDHADIGVADAREFVGMIDADT
ncbi:hypothetical protein AL755_19280 [Arthrobacter sp. ERGS1:01]|uniref:hypothetical protein n=1 Tax=Arthrobacter sp. ERGS1:01 TaxID=1704044 RepID=UPI0006B477CF|nr:hypothetical protein [Arthrobacter sp. ERGS1:01]ALE07115.1 hypothetical protein AL755_19280 [Arthrobacter sp. ERGS1:01]